MWRRSTLVAYRLRFFHVRFLAFKSLCFFAWLSILSPAYQSRFHSQFSFHFLEGEVLHSAWKEFFHLSSLIESNSRTREPRLDSAKSPYRVERISTQNLWTTPKMLAFQFASHSSTYIRCKANSSVGVLISPTFLNNKTLFNHCISSRWELFKWNFSWTMNRPNISSFGISLVLRNHMKSSNVLRLTESHTQFSLFTRRFR